MVSAVLKMDKRSVVKRFCPEEFFPLTPDRMCVFICNNVLWKSADTLSFLHRFSSLLRRPFSVKRKKNADSCIFPPAATTAFTRSAERKQSGYCVPLEWPAPILTAPTPPTMTTRGTDMHCCCRCRCCCCTRTSTILWSPRVVPLSVFNFPALVHVMTKTISCPISEKVITALEMWMWRDETRLPLNPEAQSFVSLPAATFLHVCSLCTHVHSTNSGMLITAFLISGSVLSVFWWGCLLLTWQWRLWCIAVGWTGAASMRDGLLAHLYIGRPTTHLSPGATSSPSIRKKNPTFH